MAVTAAGAKRPLLTAITDPFVYKSSDAQLGFKRTRQAGAKLVRLDVNWAHVTPHGRQKPRDFDAADPADPRYDFSELDRQVRLAVASKLQPVISIAGAPVWAEDKSPHPEYVDGFLAGPYKPSPAEVGSFGHALAVRYGGSFHGLPRVRYWRFWNESNLIGYLSPQFEHGKPFAPIWYRSMLSAFAGAVHKVHADNVVVAGSLAPFHFKQAAMGPLQFMRTQLCLSAGKKPKPTCSKRSIFDAYAVQPYTSGGPTHHATSSVDLSLGDLPEAKRVLRAAVKAHHVASKHKPPLWVTEFSWDTRPPDPNPRTAPLALQSLWTAEALYRMWHSGVEVVTWFLLRDVDWPASSYQSGLYFRSGIGLRRDIAKPTLTAFRFPFVDFRHGKSRYVWGRTPGGKPGRVVVEQRLRKKWKRLATLRAGSTGVFSAMLKRKIVQPKAPKRRRFRGSYRKVVLADHPSAYWRLGRSGGTRDLMGGRTATASGGVSFGGSGALLNERDGAATFDGSSGRIDLGPVGSPKTIELWVKTRSSAQTPIFSDRDALQRFTFIGSFERIPEIYDGFNLFGGRTIANGRWHQLVFSYSGITGRVYVDGRLDAENTWIRTSASGASANLGFDVPLGTHLKGSIDEVALYDHPLSAARVAKHYRASGRLLAAHPDLGGLRARLAGSKDASLVFPLKPPPDVRVLPFGG